MRIFITTIDGITINEVNIYNQLGQRVKKETHEIEIIDISMLIKGMYIIELISNEFVIRDKLLIE